jgi:hypothetical protein
VYPSARLGAPTGVSTGHLREPPYWALLETAHAFGRRDGHAAARFEPHGPVDPPSTCCRGRDPAAFARLLWGDRPGDPPSGLEVNAPLWYARGFADGLAAERRWAERRRTVTAAGTGLPRRTR